MFVIVFEFKSIFMKTKLLFLILCAFTNSFAQNNSPFSENNPKRFQNTQDALDNEYFFYPQMIEIIGDTVVFKQYYKMTNQTVDVLGTSCEGWGGGFQPVIDSTWLGRDIGYNEVSSELYVSNGQMEPLTFDFSLLLGDSSLFYQDITNEYYIKHTMLSSENIFGVIDMVKTFVIKHYDLSGSPLVSPLHNFEIKLAENLGLIQFISCYDFPQTEIGLSLKGQLHPTIGEYQMTYDEAFPWNTGDTLEYVGYNSFQQGGPSTTIYSRYVITDRIETVDSVFIFFDYDEQLLQLPAGMGSYPSAYTISYQSPIKYKKGDNVIEQPSGMAANSTDIYFADSIDDCGMRGRIRKIGAFNVYCDECNCMTAYDGFMSALEFEDYQTSKGITYKKTQGYGPSVSPLTSSLIYSNINGEICGDYIALGLEEIDLSIKLFPNPTSELLNVELPVQMNSALVLDAQGKEMMSIEINELAFFIDTSKLEKGVYLLSVKNDAQSSATRFIID
jgi:hypothetical protein